MLVSQAHLKSGGDVKVLLHVGAQDLVDAAAAHMLHGLALQRCKLERTNSCQNNAPEKRGKVEKYTPPGVLTRGRRWTNGAPGKLALQVQLVSTARHKT